MLSKNRAVGDTVSVSRYPHSFSISAPVAFLISMIPAPVYQRSGKSFAKYSTQTVVPSGYLSVSVLIYPVKPSCV